MQSFHHPEPADLQFDSALSYRPVRLTVHEGRVVAAAPVRPVIDSSPLHSIEAFAGAMFVATVAVGWIVVASTATAPLVAASEMLSRAAKALEKN